MIVSASDSNSVAVILTATPVTRKVRIRPNAKRIAATITLAVLPNFGGEITITKEDLWNTTCFTLLTNTKL